MKEAVIIDTNVLVASNGDAPHVAAECILACIHALREARDKTTCIDDFRILKEYRLYANARGEPGPGDAFFKYVFDNQANPERCECVILTCLNEDEQIFGEFPADKDLKDFDPKDRKFVVVALKSQFAPPIQYAADRGWVRYKEPLTRNGVTVEALCET